MIRFIYKDTKLPKASKPIVTLPPYCRTLPCGLPDLL
nr:MAG TPA: hypothetical protein [Caudoviricetes sp.]DAS28773.1 MAG TPA: hypothetical protein [Caudoviricetes sp.]